MKTLHLICAAASSLCLFGCLDALDPNVGEPLVERCVNQDSDPGTDLSFTNDILPIFLGERGPGCNCHIPTDPNPIGFEQTGLDLSSYRGLRNGGINSQSSIVVEREPCSSVVWQKISPGPPFGSRMPFNGPPFLDLQTRTLISDWIAEGAIDN